MIDLAKMLNSRLESLRLLVQGAKRELYATLLLSNFQVH